MKAKKIIALLLAVFMLAGVLSGCAKDETPGTNDPSGNSGNSGEKVINVWSFTDEIPNMLKRYKELNPSFPYSFNITIIPTTEGAYQPALDQALLASAGQAPDIFAAEQAFVLKYSQGDASGWALTYKELGIDIGNAITAAEISPFAYQIGTRPSDGEVIALPFQSTGSAFIYRSSIAIDTWGTDDPNVVKTKIGPGWDKFMSAAEELKAKGYAIVSGDGDVWKPMQYDVKGSWIVDGKLNIDPGREKFFDIAKQLWDNDYTNKTENWQDPWFADMGGVGPKGVLGFFGPAWLINYTLGDNAGNTFGDWRVCEPTVGFFWGGTWVFASKNINPDVRDGVKTLIEWITLDYSETGLQYYWANGNLFAGSTLFPDQAADYAKGDFTKDTVASGAVMKKSDGTLSFLGGQDMFEQFVPAAANARGDMMTQYDETFESLFRDQVDQYKIGEKTKEEALEAFKQNVLDTLDIPS